MDRRWELDALRGLMLVLMTFTHLPTRLSDPLGQPFGFVSAAEGFVFLSAYMAGGVYTQRALRKGTDEMASAFWRRALKLYALQAALLVFVFSVIAAAGVASQQEAVLGMLGFYFERPLQAFVAGLALLYNPPLLDILPMYIVFMLVSPIVLLHGMRHGWIAILAVSLLTWLAAQFGLTDGIRQLVDTLTGAKIPIRHSGAFDLLAWQFLWIAGLWLGSSQAAGAITPRFPPAMVAAAWAAALVCFGWRHGIGQTPFPGDASLNLLFDKWHIGPLRLLDFLALLLLVMHHGPWLKAHLPRWRVLETLGSAALPVFCAHLVAALVALAVFGAATPERPWSVDAAILTGSFALLWIVARVTAWADQRTAALRTRISAGRSAPASR